MAVLHALASSANTKTSFLTIMVLPVWEGTPWQSAAIRSHANMETLIHIPTGHMRFVPTYNQSEGEAHQLAPAKWPVELVLVVNVAVKAQFLDMGRVHDILGPAIREVCQISEAQTTFFSHSHTPSGATTEMGDLRPTRPIPTWPTLTKPPTPPRV